MPNRLRAFRAFMLGTSSHHALLIRCFGIDPRRMQVFRTFVTKSAGVSTTTVKAE